MKAIVLDGYTLNPGDLSWEKLEELCSLTIYDKTLPEEVFERAKDAEIIFTNKTILSKELLEKFDKLKYIGVLATGYNVVDISAAAELGITVTNAPSYSSDSVAQLVFAYVLNFASRVQEHSKEVHGGKWSACKHFCYHSFPLTELAGKTFGIAGFGTIGQKTAVLAEAFGMKVIYFNRSEKKNPLLKNALQTDYKTLLKDSDFISLNVPLNSGTEKMINAETLSLVKKNVYIINTGRGNLVDEAAVAEALITGRIAGFATDVLSTEPPAQDNPLLHSPNCIITPHMAWQTVEARSRLMQITCDNLKSFLNGKPENKVN